METTVKPLFMNNNINLSQVCDALNTGVPQVVEGVPTDTAAVEVTHAYIIKYIMQASFELYMHE